MTYIRLASLILDNKLSNAEIARQCRVCRLMIPKYRDRLRVSGITKDNLKKQSEHHVKSILYPPPKKPETLKFDQPDWDKCLDQLARAGVRKSDLYEKYESVAKRPMSYQTFLRRLQERSKARGPVMRFPREPGVEVFVDFSGKRPLIHDAQDGKVIPVELFVACLGYSRLTFAMAVSSQSTEDWIKAHVTMFAYFQGVSRYIVPDNLKAAVIHPRSKDQALRANDRYASMLRHYGCEMLPARPGKPRDKGLAEQSVQLTQRWIILPLSRQKFFSIQELNEAILPLLERLNSKPMKRLKGKSRKDLYQEEVKSLLPLPTTPFQSAQHFGRATVQPDYHLPIDGNFYSVPHELIGEVVEIFKTDTAIIVYHNRGRVALHQIAKGIGATITLKEHTPENHRAYAQHRHRHFRTWGSYQSAPIRAYLRAHLECWKNPYATEQASRRLQKLVAEHGIELVNCATERVNETAKTGDDASLHLSISRVMELLSAPANLLRPLSTNADQTIAHENIRGASYYE